MSYSVEERLERAGRTLDAASARYTTRTTRRDDPAPVPARQRHPRRLAGVTAAMVGTVVAVVVVVANLGSTADPDPLAGVPGSGDPIAAAVATTRAAEALAVDVRGSWRGAPDGAEAIWNYGAPDRWEQMEQSPLPRIELSPPGGSSIRLYVGSETWRGVEGRWSREVPAHRDPAAPLDMLQRLTATDCRGESDGQLIGWSVPSGECGPVGSALPVGLLPGSEVWVVRLDDSGRIAEIRSGEVLDLGDDVNLADSPDPLVLAGAVGRGVAARFWYDNVPEVSGRPVE